MKGYAENKAYGTVEPIKGTNPRQLYEHQKQAMENLSIVDTEEKYSTLVVLPTGGGKTYTLHSRDSTLGYHRDKCRKAA